MHTGMNEWGARLSALAQFEAPAAGWAAVLAARRQRNSKDPSQGLLALAAALLALAAGLGWFLQSGQRELAVDPAPAGALLAGDAIRAENARLEWLLATLPERHAMRGSTAFTVAELEDRLALLDDRLTRVTLEPHAPEQAERLWQERVDLMNSLVQVRYADVADTF